MTVAPTSSGLHPMEKKIVSTGHGPQTDGNNDMLSVPAQEVARKRDHDLLQVDNDCCRNYDGLEFCADDMVCTKDDLLD